MKASGTASFLNEAALGTSADHCLEAAIEDENQIVIRKGFEQEAIPLLLHLCIFEVSVKVHYEPRHLGISLCIQKIKMAQHETDVLSMDICREPSGDVLSRRLLYHHLRPVSSSTTFVFLRNISIGNQAGLMRLQ